MVSRSSYAGRSSSSRRGAETIVSRQPRLPQRQTGPSSPTWTCPISPAIPLAPRCSRPPSTIPAPTTAGHLEVDDVVPPACDALLAARPGRRGWRRCPRDRHVEPALELLGRQQPLPARHDPGPDPGGTAVQRSGHAHADRLQLPSAPAPADQAGADHPCGQVERLDAMGVDVDQGVVLGEHLAGAVGDRDPDVAVPDVHPGHAAGRRAERRAGPGAVRCRPCGAGPGRRSRSTWPARDQLGDQAGHGGAREAVPRTRSARLVGPSSVIRPRTRAGWRRAAARGQPGLGMRGSLGELDPESGGTRELSPIFPH